MPTRRSRRLESRIAAKRLERHVGGNVQHRRFARRVGALEPLHRPVAIAGLGERLGHRNRGATAALDQPGGDPARIGPERGLRAAAAVGVVEDPPALFVAAGRQPQFGDGFVVLLLLPERGRRSCDGAGRNVAGLSSRARRPSAIASSKRRAAIAWKVTTCAASGRHRVVAAAEARLLEALVVAAGHHQVVGPAVAEHRVVGAEGDGAFELRARALEVPVEVELEPSPGRQEPRRRPGTVRGPSASQLAGRRDGLGPRTAAEQRIDHVGRSPTRSTQVRIPGRATSAQQELLPRREDLLRGQRLIEQVAAAEVRLVRVRPHSGSSDCVGRRARPARLPRRRRDALRPRRRSRPRRPGAGSARPAGPGRSSAPRRSGRSRPRISFASIRTLWPDRSTDPSITASTPVRARRP